MVSFIPLRKERFKKDGVGRKEARWKDKTTCWSVRPSACPKEKAPNQIENLCYMGSFSTEKRQVPFLFY